jgi:dTDP-4-amino-4,6-dideoxygalactose transaminase
VKNPLIGGKSPMFSQPLHVGRPNIGSASEIHRYIDEILERRWLSNDGQVVQEFERKLAEYIGVKHCLAVCNATIGLEIAYRVAGLSGEVIVPANTFAATVHALQWQGIKPVFCDIDPNTHNLDLNCVEELITDHTSGIIGVHVWGRPCPALGLESIAHKHGLRLLFDAAHAFGCSLNGQMIGNFGNAEVFSFHATKFVTCGEGGAIATNDDDFAAAIRETRSFGFQGCDRIVRVGTNGKMSEFAAAVGLSSLGSIDEFIQVNKQNYETYRQVLTTIPGVNLLCFDEQEKNNFQYVVVEIDERSSPLSRDQWLQVLHAENVLARRYFYPGVHRSEPYCSLDPFAVNRLPVTEATLKRVLVLPTGTAVGVREIELIGSIFNRATMQAPQLRRQLPVHLGLPTVPISPLERKAA